MRNFNLTSFVSPFFDWRYEYVNHQYYTGKKNKIYWKEKKTANNNLNN